MKLIYGVKMIDTRDIIAASTGRQEKICNYLKNLIMNDKLDAGREFLNITINISICGNCPIINTVKPYILIFAPKDLVEKYLIKESVVPGLQSISDILPKKRKFNGIEKTINKYESEYSDIELKYIDKDLIETTNCYMFIYENNRFFDVYTGSPRDVTSYLMTPDTYTCSVCGATQEPDKMSVSEYLPKMRYYIVDGSPVYICETCTYEGHMTDLKHVGE